MVVIGVLVAGQIMRRLDNRRYGRWQVNVIDDDGVSHLRDLSPQKAKQVLEMPEEKSVYFKGVAGTWGRLNCDLITEGVQTGLLIEDFENRCFTIDLRLNPPPVHSTSAHVPEEVL